ncbi:Arrestin domain-containing protein D [Phytophthora cinnamomi]|uniref:Arrestin domain-containing protein D n=1 Tax=Phytophthora cinnamomi TaxID=4785 RepID=UPI003559F3B6|nr:Arrestin domain-containing protein D [Phytophthora cinnamomi]
MERRPSVRSTSRSGRSASRNDMDSSMANSSNCANLRLGSNGAANGYTPGKLPLPDDYFSVPQLSSKENKYLLGLAKHACKEVVYYSRQDDGPMKWLHLSSEDGVDVFQGVDSSSSAKSQQDTKALTYLRGSCRIRATIDEISDFFKLDTVDKLSGFTQTVGKDVLDQKTLLTLATPTPDNPKHYVAVKWTAVESPSKLARNRDFCYIECHDEFIDTNTKRRGWVRSIHSIRLPFCPPLSKSHGLVRGSLYRSGFIFTESAEKGCVDAVHTLHVDIKGSAPNWMKILVMKRRIKNIAEVDRHFQLQRLAHGRLLGDLELPAKDSATRCQLCDAKFGLFHRRRRCRKCAKIVCTPCANEFLLDYAGMGPKKVRICVECSESEVYGVRVPVMDSAGQIIADEHTGAKQILESDIHHMYDDFPMGDSVALLQSRQLSIEEHEFYMKNEDENGIADMEEAKRMNREFEELLMKTSDEIPEEETEEESSRRFDPIAKSLLDANSASGETIPVETPLGGELAPWEERRKREAQDEYDNDDELGLPPSKSEQMRKQLQYEDQMRREHIERAKKLHQYATGASPQSSKYFSTGSTEFGEHRVEQQPRPKGIVRNESGDSIRLSSEWGDEYCAGRAGIGRIGPEVMTSFRSNESGSSGRARAAYGSVDSREAANMVSRPNSMYGVADSDTFSDMDLIDLPHLMRKDDVETGARNSFADLQQWTEETHDEGVEYVPEPRLSDLLSPLHLEGVQHVEDDDSESQSSTSSSQIDWRRSLTNKFPREQGRAESDSESSFIRAYSITHQNEVEPYSDLTNSGLFATNGLSASMVTQDEQPQRRYRKPPSLSELLAEYSGSERSSLPSYLEFGGSQPELEPEYLQAIENSRLNGSDQSSIPVEGGRRGHVRRRSSIPSELESLTSRELFL